MSSGAGRALLLATVVLVSFSPGPASAYCRMTTESGPQVAGAACERDGLPLFWEHPCLSYAIDSRGSQWMTMEEIEEAVDLAFETWENVDCGGAPPNLVFTPFEVSTCRRPEFNDAGNVNTIAFLDPWVDECERVNLDDAPFALAVTNVWRDGDTGKMLDADIVINDQLATQFNGGVLTRTAPQQAARPDLGTFRVRKTCRASSPTKSGISSASATPTSKRLRCTARRTKRRCRIEPSPKTTCARCATSTRPVPWSRRAMRLRSAAFSSTAKPTSLATR